MKKSLQNFLLHSLSVVSLITLCCTSAEAQVWTQMQNISLGGVDYYEGTDRMAYALDMDNRHILEGNPYGDNSASGFPPVVVYGSASIFTYSKDCGVIKTDRLLASDLQHNARFGEAVSLNGDYAIVGAPGADTKGAAYIFKKDNQNNWNEEQSS